MPHLRSPVGVEVGAYRRLLKVNPLHEVSEPQPPQVVEYGAPHRAHVQKHRVRLLLLDSVRNDVPEGQHVLDVALIEPPRVEPLPHPYGGRVLARARDVRAEDFGSARGGKIVFGEPPCALHCRPHRLRADKLPVGHVRELALDAHLHEVRVFPVGLRPLIQQFFVRHGGRPAVDADVTPQVPVFPETFSEPPRIACGVPEREPQDFRVLVGQCPLGDFPDDVIDGGGLVEDDDDPPPLVVEPRERFTVLLAPHDGVHPPA